MVLKTSISMDFHLTFELIFEVSNFKGQSLKQNWALEERLKSRQLRVCWSNPGDWQPFRKSSISRPALWTTSLDCSRQAEM